MIYFMRSVNGGPIKIGHTDDIQAQQKAMERIYCCELVVLLTMDGGPGELSQFRARFAHLQYGNSEQFRAGIDLLRFLDPNLNPAVEIDRSSERWLIVPQFPHYEVSDHGRIRTTFYRDVRILNPRKNAHGYPIFKLCNSTIQKPTLVHVLVLEAFVGPRPEGFQACHFDGVRDNNRLDNLRWDTPSGNMLDRRRTGSCKVSLPQIDEIRELRSQGVPYKDIAKRFRITTSYACNLALGRYADSEKHAREQAAASDRHA